MPSRRKAPTAPNLRSMRTERKIDLVIRQAKNQRRSRFTAGAREGLTRREPEMADLVLIGATDDFAVDSLPKVNVDDIRRQLESIRDSFEPLMPGQGTGFALNEISVELGITAGGEVGFIVAKSTVELSASISLTFSRP